MPRRMERHEVRQSRRATGLTFAHAAPQIGTPSSSAIPLDHSKPPVFADQGHNFCQLHASLYRRAKRRIALKHNRNPSFRIRFAPWNCFGVNSMLITKKSIGGGERFITFEQQWVNKRNSGPHAGYALLAQVAFDAVEIPAGNPRHTIGLSLIAER